jgi:aminopeptidase N
LSKEFYHQTVTTSQIENYISIKSGIDFSRLFDQYLRTTQIPQLTYQFKDGKLYYKWENVVPGFDMPVKITVGNQHEKWIYPKTTFTSIKMKRLDKSFKVNASFYVNTSSIN